MKFFRFLFSKTFLINLVLAALLFFALVFGLTKFLDYYTRHGDTISVPDLTDMALIEVDEELTGLGLQFEVLDSAEYNPMRPKAAVVEQFPLPGSPVKLGRVIKLTLNPTHARKVKAPDVIDKTKRRALYDLESKGFVIEEIKYIPYIGKDVVVDLLVDDEPVKFGAYYPKGSKVILVLGQGLGEEQINVPYLRWLSAKEAEVKLLEHGLIPGAVIYDENIEDTAKALIYQQRPDPTNFPAIQQGLPVDIWLTEDYTKIPDDSLEYQTVQIIDSLNANNNP